MIGPFYKKIKERARQYSSILFKLPVISWALYDFANSAFAVVIITIIFPVYFTSIIVSPTLYQANTGDLLWGISSGVVMLLASVCAPIFGAIADSSRSKNRFLIILTIICISFCALLSILGKGMVVIGVAFFILANFFYQTSMMFYNSFLPQLSSRENTGTVSGFGFSLGYLGGMLILLIILPLIKGGIVENDLFNIRLTFIITALFFLVFSIPSFLFLKDLPLSKRPETGVSYIRQGIKKLLSTLRNIRKYKDLSRFLISYFLFSNAFSVFALFISIYAKNTLGLSLFEITILFIIGHIPAIVGSLFFGWLTDKIGPRNTITLTLVIWVIVILILTLLSSKIVFYLAFVLAAIITGSTLIASRSLMSLLIPLDSEAEFFGFYAISGKFSAILGPAIFGMISFFTKSQRIALLSTVLFLIGGLVLLQFVNVKSVMFKKRP